MVKHVELCIVVRQTKVVGEIIGKLDLDARYVLYPPCIKAQGIRKTIAILVA
jgi:hypothetical protein